MELPEARWWRATEDDSGAVRCELCPRGCHIRDGQTGFCRARKNAGGRLVSLTYGQPLGVAVDPIEKKPLYHFLPGTTVLSFGTAGCTLACTFCQNWSLSQGVIPNGPRRGGRPVDPGELVTLAHKEKTPTIAYTYNEPTVFAEYLVEVAVQARAAGLNNVMVSNGYIAPEARREVFAPIDAVNVDLKGFSEAFYREHTQAALAPVLDTLLWVGAQPGIWLEITTLLIPGLNDSEEMLGEECQWIASHLGPDVPVHFTAFHPAYKMTDRPRTPLQTLVLAREIALHHGLRYIYLGNVGGSDGQDTICPHCRAVTIEREGFRATILGLADGRCSKCNGLVAGVFGE